MSRNPFNCPHNIIEYDKETMGYYCSDCGDTLDVVTQDDEDD